MGGPRISRENITACWQYFETRGWPPNKALPRKGGDPHLDAFIDKIKLSNDRDKVARQLKNWRDAKKNRGGVALKFNKQVALGVVRSHTHGKGLDYDEFVRSAIRRMLPPDENKETDPEDSEHYKNFQHYVMAKGELGQKLLKFVMEREDLVKFFSNLVHWYEALLVQFLPKRMQQKNTKSLQFNAAKQKGVAHNGRFREIFRDSLAKTNASSVFPKCTSDDWDLLFCNIEISLYNSWRIKCFESKRLEVKIPEQSTVKESAKKVLAYIGGWLLMNLKKNKGFNKKPMLGVKLSLVTDFLFKHSLDERSANASGIPASYIEARMTQKGKLHYPSESLLSFLCRVESTYMDNYNLKMLVSHGDGSLLQEILKALKKSKSIQSEFAKLCPSSIRCDTNDSPGRKILEYLLTKFRNMRVKQIGKSHKALRSKAENRLDQGSTRTRVCHLGMQKKAVNAALAKVKKNEKNASCGSTQKKRTAEAKAGVGNASENDNCSTDSDSDDGDGIDGSHRKKRKEVATAGVDGDDGDGIDGSPRKKRKGVTTAGFDNASHNGSNDSDSDDGDGIDRSHGKKRKEVATAGVDGDDGDWIDGSPRKKRKGVTTAGVDNASHNGSNDSDSDDDFGIDDLIDQVIRGDENDSDDETGEDTNDDDVDVDEEYEALADEFIKNHDSDIDLDSSDEEDGEDEEDEEDEDETSPCFNEGVALVAGGDLGAKRRRMKGRC